jgi:hypothetical protein
MAVLSTLYSLFSIRRLSQVEKMRTEPCEVQQKQLDMLLEEARDTEWGKKYDYASITSIEEYQKRVPISTYNDAKEDIERMIKGEEDVLWKGTTKWFAKSSGTTEDKSKFIPVSKDSLETCHLQGGKDVLTLYSENVEDTGFFSGKMLTLGGSHQPSDLNEDSRVGDLSSIYLEHTPFILEFFRTPAPEIALLNDFEEKLKRIAEVAIDENVTSILGVPSWNLVLLRHILEVTGKKNILEVWPNLEMFAHGGISFEPYREQYQKLIPSENMHYIEIYNASEGFFAIQDDLNDKGMLLMLDYGVFYEFIPMSEFGTENPTVLSIGDVKEDVNYALLISTNSGLWRYLIGDTIRFTSTYPHKIVITGRTTQFINAFGEEVIINNTNEAMRLACEKTGASITNYSAAPVFMTEKQVKGKHQWVVEFDEHPEDIEVFAQLLDNELQKLNSDYEAKRTNNVTLNRLELIAAEKGLFHHWMKERGKLGGQHKVPRLSNSRTYVESLLELNTRLLKKHDSSN